MKTQSKASCTLGCANTILMIEPVAFGYNAETAVNNFFQQPSRLSDSEIQHKALAEFKGMTDLLQAAGVKVITVQDTLYPHTPDSIYPNNWISFHLNNHVVFYPMFAENRRLERRMDVLLEVERELDRKFHYTDYSAYEMQNIFLEGTGSLVLDRYHRVAYASLSPRTDERLIKKFCDEMDFRPVCFHATQTVNGNSEPIYHTNILMCVADKFAVICLNSITDEKERNNLVKELTNSDKEMIELSVEQMNRFAGNMIQLKNENEEKLLILSQSAFDSLDKDQISRLESFNKLIVVPIPTIESHGGGSVRCMITEVF